MPPIDEQAASLDDAAVAKAKKGPHGGKRDGAGRPKSVEDGVPVAIWLPADIAARYSAAATVRETTGGALMRAVLVEHAPP